MTIPTNSEATGYPVERTIPPHQVQRNASAQPSLRFAQHKTSLGNYGEHENDCEIVLFFVHVVGRVCGVSTDFYVVRDFIPTPNILVKATNFPERCT